MKKQNIKLNQKIPYIPVVLHTFFSEYIATSKILAPTEFVEKGGNSIEQLKKVIGTILNNNISTNLGKG